MAFDLKREKKVIVPWFSMSEWEEVYNQLYSEDPAVQGRGYERLLVWKARCVTLPAGVECTMILVHACLQDREVWPQIVSGSLPPYREQDLRLMYSTAVMRFLNHISTVARDGAETLYKIAKKLHIPDWVVNVRNDVAHGITVPPLAVLREAVHFALTWIHEHYWKGESEVTGNYVGAAEPDSQSLSRQLQDNLELWQAVKLYLQAGYLRVGDIPDLKLKLQAEQLLESVPRKEKKVAVDCLSAEVLDQVAQQLQDTVKRHAPYGADHLLVSLLLDGEAFLPAEHVLAVMGSGESDETRTSLPPRLLHLWQDLLTSLQTVNILPVLITKLIQFSRKTGESEHRCRMASVWVKEICDGLEKVRRVHKFMETHRLKMESKNKSEKQINKNILNKFDKSHPQYKNVLDLRLTCLPDVNVSLVKQAMLAPNRWSIIFLPSLLALVEPALPPTTVSDLVSLLEVYTSQVVPVWDEPERQQLPVHTVESLGHAPPVLMETPLVDAADAADGWARSEAYHEWENCPLGVLPWQRNVPVVDLDLPRDTTWTRARPPVALKVNTLASVHKIDWNQFNLTKKRSKKLKRAASSNLVKNAFEIIIGKEG